MSEFLGMFALYAAGLVAMLVILLGIGAFFLGAVRVFSGSADERWAGLVLMGAGAFATVLVAAIVSDVTNVRIG